MTGMEQINPNLDWQVMALSVPWILRIASSKGAIHKLMQPPPMFMQKHNAG
jgi:hypothetical protein